MIMVGFDRGTVQGGGVDYEGVTDFLNLGTAFRQLGAECLNSFAFLNSQAT